jgi:hypothetical protein
MPNNQWPSPNQPTAATRSGPIARTRISRPCAHRALSRPDRRTVTLSPPSRLPLPGFSARNGVVRPTLIANKPAISFRLRGERTNLLGRLPWRGQRCFAVGTSFAPPGDARDQILATTPIIRLRAAVWIEKRTRATSGRLLQLQDQDLDPSPGRAHRFERFHADHACETRPTWWLQQNSGGKFASQLSFRIDRSALERGLGAMDW